MSKTNDTKDVLLLDVDMLFELTPGRFAYGEPGKQAIHSVQRFKTGGAFIGVRGIKPTIPADAKPRVEVPAAAIKALTKLVNTKARAR